jgi:MtN3 and saliva related transmembrane protein
MAADNVTTIVGSAAAMCTTLSFVPQLVKIRRQGGRDLSDGMLMLYLLGLTLWLAYGVRIEAAEVIAANVVAGTLVIAAMIMKRRAATPADAGGRTPARARTLAQTDCRTALLERVKSLRPGSARRWGRMTAHQMLCHLIDCNRMALGELVVAAPKARVPRAIVKWVSLYTPMPWPAGIPTNPELDQDVAGTRPSDPALEAVVARGAHVHERDVFAREQRRGGLGDAFRRHDRAGAIDNALVGGIAANDHLG